MAARLEENSRLMLEQSPNAIIYSQGQNEWQEYSAFVERVVQTYHPTSICDVGGGCNPVLSPEVVQREKLDYTILDISAEELAKAPAGYRKVVQDIESEQLPWTGKFDLVITKMLVEHLRDTRKFHRNVLRLLKPGGIAVHYFPTLYALPFVVNKIIPEHISHMLLDAVLPRERSRYGKFAAYYNWCYGPTPAMLRMLRNVGFEIVHYHGIIGHGYLQRVPLVNKIHNAYSTWLARHPNPYLTSFAQVILRKPVPGQQIH